MKHSYIAYIDEAGDDGLSGKYRGLNGQGGASHWLVLTATIWRASRDIDSVRWRDEVISTLGGKFRRDTLHCQNLNHQQRFAAASCLSNKPIRIINILSYKKSIPDGIYREKNQLYFYLCRYLMERISWFCRDQREFVPEGNGKVKIIFSRRGGMSYENFREYLCKLKRDRSVTINWSVLDVDAIDALDHKKRAGLQISDIAATCFSNAVEPDYYGNCEIKYAKKLKPLVYRHNRRFINYGIKVVKGTSAAELSAQQNEFVDLFDVK